MSTNTETQSEIENDLTRLTNELGLMRNITGIRITDTECTVTNVEQNSLERKYSVEGTCGSIGFRIQFNVRETWKSSKKTDDTVSEIQELKADISDQECETTLRNVLERLEASCSVTLLLHVLSTYGEWSLQRTEMAAQVCEMYPDMAEITDNDDLVIRPKSIPGSQLIFTWLLSFAPDSYRATSRWNLIIRVPKNVDDVDEYGVLRSAPAMFNKMQETLGAGKALETLLKSLCV